MFDRTFICSNFSLIMNFVVFDTNKFDEKFQFFVSAAEKKPEFFDMHRKFSKNSDFDDEIKNVATAKMKKDFVSRDLTNKKLTELLKTFFFFEIQKTLFFIEKNVFDFLNIYDELCAEHEIIEKNKIKRLHKYCNFTVFLFI